MAKVVQKVKVTPRIKYAVTARMITPANATAMLKHNSYNRPLNHAKCKMYSEQMQDGTFMRNGDTICFGWDGILLDGQNRLTAIVDSGISIDTIVVTGLDPKVFNTIDIGKIRSLAQLLAKEGALHSQIAAGMTAALITYDLGMAPYHSTTNLAAFNTHEKRITYYVQNQQFLEPSMDFIIAHGADLVGLNKARFAFLYHVMARLDYDAAQEFFRAFFGDKGINIPAAHILKDRFVKDTYRTMRSSQMSDKKKMALMIKAWNLYRTNTPVGNRLSFQDGGSKPEAFPEAI